MDIIEFFKHTDHRNLKYNIGIQVKHCMREAEEELNEKRERLRQLLESENLQYDEELALLCKQQAEANKQKRLDWINSMRLEEELAEKELLKLKQIQRERENCEELRHTRTKELLLDTKQAQIYQIEDKKQRKLREQQIDRMWEQAMQSLMHEKEKQDYYEKKLQDVIAGKNQAINLKQEQDIKTKAKQHNTALKSECDEDNKRAVEMEKVYRERERLDGIWKKSQQFDALKTQMSENALKLEMEKNMSKQIDQVYVDIDQKLANHLEEKARAKLENRVYHACYLAHALEEQEKKQQRENELDAMLAGTGCVLHQRNKKPYGKDKR